MFTLSFYFFSQVNKKNSMSNGKDKEIDKIDSLF